MKWAFNDPEDVRCWFYEIDLSLEEKREILDKLNALEPISVNNSMHAWDAIYNLEGTVYRIYGPITNWEFDENNLIVRLEPYERHSER
jgi:hypothetical protein